MEGTDDQNLKAINASVGRLVWVRLRNGSWWPGQTLLHEEVPVSPKPGTPIKLLGRDDVGIDWYILEKSKSVKAFRCGEYDTHIEKAKASAAAARARNKKTVKCTRRENAIINALEIEDAHLAKEDHPDDNLCSSSGDEDTVSDDRGEAEDGLEVLQSSMSSQEMNNIGALVKVESKRRTPNDSEDEGTKRMRGLEDIGKEHVGAIVVHRQELGSVCDVNLSDSMSNGYIVPSGYKVCSPLSLKRKRSQVTNAIECSKRKNRRRQLTKVLESTTMVCDSKVPGMEPVESMKSLSVVINNNSDSTGVSCENVPENVVGASHNNNKAKDSEISSLSVSAEEDDSAEQLYDVPLTEEANHSTGGLGMNPSMDDMNLLQQAQRHQLVVSNLGEGIDLEIGPGEDEAAFATNSLISGAPQEASTGEHDETKHMVLVSDLPSEDQDTSKGQPSAKRKKKVVKRWREEWADTYKWAYVDMKDGTARIFCSVCREYGRKHRRNPYGNEGSRNMQMSALEEHNNSLLHKEALRLQTASKDKIVVDKPIYVKTLMSKSAGSIVEGALKRDPNEIEFIQSVQECVHALERVIANNSHYVNIMERLLEPERMIVFRVPWVDDRGETNVNRGFRVQFNQALGPCRGGIRFHPSMNLSIAKFLGFQQTLKNALSPYKLGGASGGSDFDPKGRSDNEIMRFCQSFMNEMYRYMGPDKDLPSEEVGVGTREMGYLFGQYRRLAGQFQGSFTGPRIYWAASSLRTEASGYGVVYFARPMLADMNKEIKGLRCVVSGCGKIAMHVVEKLIACGAHPVTVSDSKGYLVDDDGFDYMKLAFLREIKSQQRSLRDYSKTYARAKYFDEVKPWNERCDVAFPCASQNEVDQADAINLVNAGCRLLVEGSNMPCTAEAVDVFRKANVLIAPAIAAGAGGVAAGEIEVQRESNSMQWSAEDFESRLQEALKQTYEKALKAANDFGYQKESPEALLHGATIAAFLNVAQAMTDQGCV